MYDGLSLGACAMHFFRGIGSSSSAVYSPRDLGHKESSGSHHEFEFVSRVISLLYPATLGVV